MSLYIWENSIGNINDPDFDANVIKNEKVLKIIWLVWWLNQFVIVIIMLNFLISVISQSYENVMNSKEVMKYRNRSTYNRETYYFLDMICLLNFFTFKKLTGRKQINENQIIISIPTAASIVEETSEWAGFVQTMKKFVRKHIHVTNSSIDNI